MLKFYTSHFPLHTSYFSPIFYLLSFADIYVLYLRIGLIVLLVFCVAKYCLNMTIDPSPRLWIYDTTLRDGTQREGLSVSIEDKLRIARQLDQLGIPFIEGGWPGANPKDVQFFWQLKVSKRRLCSFTLY
jgi:hypothetical protein